jgi:hypothetical protein
MRKIVFSALCLLCFLSSLAQNPQEDYYTPHKKNNSPEDRVSVAISSGVGMGFSSSTRSANSFYYLAPKIGYQFTNRFRLNLGTIYYNSYGSPFTSIKNNEPAFFNKNTASGNLLFVEGQYFLNPRTILSSGVAYGSQNFLSQINYKAMMMGIQYKVSEKAVIQFQTFINQGTYQHTNYPNGMNNSSNSFNSIYNNSSFGGNPFFGSGMPIIR